jgi:hypothetical protein
MLTLTERVICGGASAESVDVSQPIPLAYKTGYLLSSKASSESTKERGVGENRAVPSKGNGGRGKNVAASRAALDHGPDFAGAILGACRSCLSTWGRQSSADFDWIAHRNPWCVVDRASPSRYSQNRLA